MAVPDFMFVTHYVFVSINPAGVGFVILLKYQGKKKIKQRAVKH